MQTIRTFAAVAVLFGCVGAIIGLGDARRTGGVAVAIVNPLVAILGATAAVWWANHIVSAWTKGRPMLGQVRAMATVLLVLGGLAVFSTIMQILLEGGLDLTVEVGPRGAITSVAPLVSLAAGLAALGFGLVLHRQRRQHSRSGA